MRILGSAFLISRVVSSAVSRRGHGDVQQDHVGHTSSLKLFQQMLTIFRFRGDLEIGPLAENQLDAFAQQRMPSSAIAICRRSIG